MSLEFVEHGVIGPVGPYDKGLLLFDGWEPGDSWDTAGTGVDWSWGRQSSVVYSGGYAAWVKTRATNPADGDYVRGQKSFAYPYRNKIFVRLRFQFVTTAVIDHLLVQIDLFDGVKNRRASFKYSPATMAFEYLNTLGTYSQLSALSINCYEGKWHQLDFALDLSLNQYVEAYLSGKYADMRTIGFYEVVASTRRYGQIYLYLEANSANQAQVYIDDVFIGEHVVI